MPSNNSKYSEEFRNQTAQFIIENNRSATSVAEELGIDVNTVCRWVRAYRRAHNMPTHAEEKGIKTHIPKDSMDLKQRVKELEKQIKEKDKIIEEKNKKLKEEKEKIEILKKSLHIFMQAQE